MSSAVRAEDRFARLASLGSEGQEGIQLGLERMSPLLRALGDPHLRRPSILIGGTNGKGSVAAWLASIAGAAGYRVGLFTSPHLESPNEQIRIDDRILRSQELVAYLEKILEAGAELRLAPSVFEAWTLAAFLHFDAQDVDLMVLEVGLGGRGDATNVASPLFSVITSIGLDHERWLGGSLESISREKAGIARPRRALIACTEDERVFGVLKAHCDTVGAHLQRAEHATSHQISSVTQDHQELLVRTPRQSYRLHSRLLGRHQGGNLSLALLAAERLHDCGFSRIDARAITAGVASCSWPGRLEWLTAADGRRVLLDAAHNPGGAAALAHFLAELGEPYDLLFGALGDKVVQEMLPPLCRGAQRVVLTRPVSPRAVDPRSWLDLVPQSPPPLVLDDPLQALDAALASNQGPLVICGSLFLIGPLRKALRETYGFSSSISG